MATGSGNGKAGADVSDFLDAAVEMLAEYGEPVTIKNRSGTTTATAVKAYADPTSGFEDYYPENAENAEDMGFSSIYLDGTVTLQDGYLICRTAGTHQVLTIQSPQDGTTVAIRIAKCRRQ